MHEQALMTESDDKQFFDTLTRTSAIVIALCASPLYFLYAYFGDPGRGRTAAICAFVIISIARGFWNSRNRIWFWITLTIVVLLHVPLILLVSWSNTNYPGVVLLPLGLLDFAFVYGCYKLGAKDDSHT
jgi:hypothetical protein